MYGLFILGVMDDGLAVRVGGFVRIPGAVIGVAQVKKRVLHEFAVFFGGFFKSFFGGAVIF